MIQLSSFEYYLFWLTAILVNGFVLIRTIEAIIEEIQEWHWKKYGKKKADKELGVNDVSLFRSADSVQR